MNNDFYAGYYEGKNPTDTVIDIYLTLILSNENKGKTPQTLKGFEVLNNNFYVNTPIHNLLAFTFDEYSSHSGVRVEDNKVVNYESAGSDDFWVSEIIIKDMSPNSDSIYIHNNTFKTECEWETSWHDAGYTHISIDGGKVSYANNKLEAASPSSSSIGRGYNGVTLVAFRKRGGNLTLTDNSFTGIYSLAQLSEHEQVSPSSLRAIGNSFTGDTRIYCGDVSRFDASFSDNVFKSRSATYLLETWAKQGSLQFVRNKVSVARPAGPILTNWSGRDLYDMRFTNLEIYGNQFRNVDQSQLLQNIRLVDKQYVTRNRFN